MVEMCSCEPDVDMNDYGHTYVTPTRLAMLNNLLGIGKPNERR